MSKRYTPPPTGDAADSTTDVVENTTANGATLSLDGIAGDLLSEQPDASPHAIAQAEADAQAQADNPTDGNGDTFNPAIHAQNADGSPRKTVGGNWAKKRGNKGKGGAPALKLPGGAVSAPAPDNKEIAARASGVAAANLLIVLGMGIGGDEWQPRVLKEHGIDEKAMLEQAWGDYFVATGTTDIPPGWALVAACGMYALPRFSMPATKSRVKGVGAWFKKKYASWRLRKHGLKAEYADNPDGKRNKGESADET